MKKSKFNLKENVVVRSLKDSFAAIKNHKLFFLLLIIGEIAFVVISSIILVYFSSEIIRYAQQVFEPLIGVEGPIDITEIYDQPLEVVESFSMLKTNMFLFGLFFLLIYLVLNGVNWDIANLIAVKKDFMIYPIKFWILTLLFLIPMGIILRIFNMISIDAMNLEPYVFITGILIAVFFYFMRISYTFAVRYEIKDIFEALKNTFAYGIKKIHIYIITFAIICGLNILSVYLIYLLLEAHIALLSLALIVFILILSWQKIYLMITTCNLVECKK